MLLWKGNSRERCLIIGAKTNHVHASQPLLPFPIVIDWPLANAVVRTDIWLCRTIPAGPLACLWIGFAAPTGWIHRCAYSQCFVAVPGGAVAICCCTHSIPASIALQSSSSSVVLRTLDFSTPNAVSRGSACVS